MRSNGPEDGFRHLALLYEGEDDFISRTLPFVRDGLARDEPVLVATSPSKCGRLAAELNGTAERVEFVDIREAGRNPACILPVWLEFAERHSGRPTRGIGEPVWADRGPAELDECEHHESLLNLAFENGPSLDLLCPYDAAALDAAALERAFRTHPLILRDGDAVESPDYLPPELAPGPFNGELPPAPGDAWTLPIHRDRLAELRGFVREWAEAAGLARRRTEDLALAVHELAANSIRHGGGTGTLRAWREAGAAVCEVRDAGRIDEPLAGRRLPGTATSSGRGLWLVNHLCDLVQVRAPAHGNVARVRIDLTRA